MNTSKSFRPSSAKGKPKSELPQQDGELEEYIEILVEHQKNCEATGKYIEAEMAKNRIKELRKELEKRKMEEMKAQHLTEKLKIEELHLKDFNDFNQFWDEKMFEFDSEARKIEEETIKRHEEEVKTFEDELEKSIPAKPKDSTELLNLRTIEAQLAKQQEYVEAHKVQQKCLALEKDEFEKWNFQRNQRIKNQLALLKTKQSNELSALRQRIFSGQDEQRKARAIELERLLQKYNNVKKEMEVQQQQELNRVEKTFKNPNSVYISKQSASKIISSTQRSISKPGGYFSESKKQE